RAERAFGLESVIAASESSPVPEPTLPAEPAIKPAVSEASSPAKTSAASLFVPTLRAAASTDQKIKQLKVLEETEVRACRKCRLCEQRTQSVFGEGNPDAQIMFIGEGPGQTEDEMGRPFVGRAGEMLNKWIAAMGLKREQVYIANIVK